MDDSTFKVLIAFAGAVIGALTAAAANMYAASRRIKEMEVSYTFKLRDGYLENARKLTAEVYVPLNIALTKLSAAYDMFRARIDFDANTVPEGSHNFFVGQCRNYLNTVDELFDRGADAYLTTDLDAKLREFNSFIRESTCAETTTTKNVFEAADGWLPFGSRTGLGYSREVLAAPLKSRTFEKKFQIELTRLKTLIKDVTLGSHERR